MMYAAIIRRRPGVTREDIMRGVMPEYRRGPRHRVAGYTEVPGGTFTPSLVTIDGGTASALFGDYVTACGLTLPRSLASSTEEEWLSSPSRCGDCFPIQTSKEVS